MCCWSEPMIYFVNISILHHTHRELVKVRSMYKSCRCCSQLEKWLKNLKICFGTNIPLKLHQELSNPTTAWFYVCSKCSLMSLTLLIPKCLTEQFPGIVTKLPSLQTSPLHGTGTKWAMAMLVLDGVLALKKKLPLRLLQLWRPNSMDNSAKKPTLKNNHLSFTSNLQADAA